jgi:catechol 2,3-dioxygenase-like lactoylglutathione lyase family enzyme
MQIKAVNHVALHVADVAQSVTFYGQVMGLQPMPRPPFSFPGAWFRIGTAQELHLIGERTEPVRSHSRGTHFALHVADVHAAGRELRAKGVPFEGPKARPDGILQIFLQDPDGHYIELCEVREGVESL